MKVRNGFVSNSSSASFIVTWKPKELVATKEEAISTIVDGEYFNSEGDDGFLAFLNRNTKKDHEWYVTTAFTSMKNSMEDFGPHIMLLLGYLNTKSDFEFFARIDKD